jgi:hypothetical protein
MQSLADRERPVMRGPEHAGIVKVKCARAFIDRTTIVDKLGVEPDDIDAAIVESIKLCLDIRMARPSARHEGE